MTLLSSIIALVIGFIVLIFSAHKLTDNGSKIANIYKISPLIIGILIFGFGTSAPEIFVSLLAAFEGTPELAVGNAIGSNILNIALVLGITAMILPIEVNIDVIRKDGLFLIFATLAAGLLLWIGKDLSRIDGFILIILLAIFLWITYKDQKKDHHKFDNLSSNVDINQKKETWVKLFFALIFLLASAQLIVFSATKLADYYHVSDLIIGLTVVALGTSLPELAVAITSAIKKQHEMIVGNIIGSNIFNTLAVLAIPGLISPLKLQKELLITDYFYMLGLTIALAIFFLYSPVTKMKDTISRLEGFGLIILLSIYIYIRFLV
ncbi:uncharacterized protein METZ01_LOCUS279657 [marine metagenome]|uniref:Sodium/calcium exchanger membrane region domain-containing protein n=1 Tax=marine metagenome TaxID=408172 RepID=A0A382KTF4_9ZZZZ